MDCVFSDVVGSKTISSFGDPKYFATLLVENGGHSMVRFVKRKYMAGEAVIGMLKILENKFNQNVQSLFLMERKSFKWFKTDNAGEYLGKTLQDWLKNRNIAQKLRTAYSQESNGRKKRLSKTLFDMSRSAMIGALRKVPDAL